MTKKLNNLEKLGEHLDKQPFETPQEMSDGFYYMRGKPDKKTGYCYYRGPSEEDLLLTYKEMHV